MAKLSLVVAALALGVSTAWAPSVGRVRFAASRAPTRVFSEEAPAEVAAPVAGDAGEGAAAEKAPLSSLEAGMELEGTVTAVMDYGAFVDVGCESAGLIHISQLADGFVSDAASIVTVGQSLPAVKVLAVNLDKKQLSLSLKTGAAEERPTRSGGGGGGRGRADLSQYESADPQAFVDGKVTGLAAFGAFVEIAPGVSGLVHISQLRDQRVENVADVVSVGEDVKVRIIEVDSGSGKIGLAMNSYQEGSAGRGGGRRGGYDDDDEEGAPRSRGRRPREDSGPPPDYTKGQGRDLHIPGIDSAPRRAQRADNLESRAKLDPGAQFDWEGQLKSHKESIAEASGLNLKFDAEGKPVVMMDGTEMALPMRRRNAKKV